MDQPETTLLVAVPGPRGRLLSYAPPEGFDPEELIGYRVQVPLQRKQVVGVVVEVQHNPPFVEGLRRVGEVLDDSASVPPHLLELTRWMAEYYFCDWVEVIRAALPAGLLQAPNLLVHWCGPILEGEWPTDVQRDRQLLRAARAAASVERLSIRRLAKLLGRPPKLITLLRRLEKHGLVILEDRQVLDRDRAHTEEVVRLIDGADLTTIPDRATARKRLLDLLTDAGEPVEWKVLRERSRVARTVLNSLEEGGFVQVERRSRELFQPGFDPRTPKGEQPLSENQGEVVRAIRAAILKSDFQPLLLTGLPGAGKTRVYIEGVREALAQGRGVLILVPEIGLTPQVVARIRSALSEPVAVLHSGLSRVQRLAAWRDVLSGRTRVAVGPRSALFAPIANLGLIVVDEEHEESYKQHDPAPRYNARDVALVRARREGATILLVSATPSLESLRLVEEGQLTRLRLTETFGSGWPIVTVVDRRREGPTAPYIGPYLARELEERGKRGEGIVLLITRRGFAPILACTDCGYREACPHCEVCLTYHKTERPFLHCHLCGFTKRVPTQCPECRGEQLHPLGAGTQRIEEELLRRYPDLMPIRMDGDTTRRPGAHERILRDFGEGHAQLLLGTQVVAKGHDFAHVTLVGVVNADPALSQPDFRSAERTFRLLVQAAGRSGRGDQPGEMVVQTINPEDEIFTSLFEPDIEGFLSRQAIQRRALSFAPYARMAMITLASHDESRAKRAAEEYADELLQEPGTVTIRGPVQAYVARVKRQWRWRILLSSAREADPSGSRMRATMKRALREVPHHPGVQVIVDVDPLEVA